MVRWRTSSSAISSKTLAEDGNFSRKSLGKAAIDAAVLFLVGNGERQDFLFGEFGKAFHGGPSINIRTILNKKCKPLTSGAIDRIAARRSGRPG